MKRISGRAWEVAGDDAAVRASRGRNSRETLSTAPDRQTVCLRAAVEVETVQDGDTVAVMPRGEGAFASAGLHQKSAEASAAVVAGTVFDAFKSMAPPDSD